jgi:hypothetical protein
MSSNKDQKFEALKTIMQELFSINQNLENLIHPNILARLVKIQDLAETTIKPEMDAENAKWEANWKSLQKIQEDNKFHSFWSLSDIGAKDMEKHTPEMTEIVFESWGKTQTHTFDKPTKITWIQFWHIADELIRKSEDSHHVYIESIYPDNKKQGSFRLGCGS